MKVTLDSQKALLKALAGETDAMLSVGAVGPVTDQARRDNILSTTCLELIKVVEAQASIIDKLVKSKEPNVTKAAKEELPKV